LLSISCQSDGSCITAGFYEDNTGIYHNMFDSLGATLKASPDPSKYGQTVTISDVVGLTDGGGTVAFTVNGSPIPACSAQDLTFVADGYEATCTTTTLTTGIDTIEATYSGDDLYTSSSQQMTQTVNQDPTKTSVASSANPAPVGRLTYTATVKPAPDGGTVTFDDNGTAITGCIALPFSSTNGQAKCHVTYASTGSHSITASYSGDTNYSPSMSPVLSVTVDAAPTSVALSSSANPIGAGKVVAYTAKVSPIPDGGTLAFSDGGVTISACAAVPVNTISGKATCKVTYAATGTHSIVATYSGDPNYLVSSSPALIESVD
jgi:hypothetical protein